MKDIFTYMASTTNHWPLYENDTIIITMSSLGWTNPRIVFKLNPNHRHQILPVAEGMYKAMYGFRVKTLK